MDEIRDRAIQLINGQARIERAIRRCKAFMAAICVLSFIVGFVAGAAMPFQFQVVPIHDADHE